MTRLDGFGPLLRDKDVVGFAHRDAEEAASYHSQQLPEALRSIDLGELRRVGVDAVAREAVARLDREELGGFWIHLDADALDHALMPAVDYQMPGGISWHELETVLRQAVASGRALGLEVTIYNPRLDREGEAGRGLVRAIGNALM